MSSVLQSNSTITPALDEIGRNISSLKSKRDRATTEMDSLSRKNDEYDAEIDRLTVKKRHVQERLGTSKKEVDKLDKTISDAEATYSKLLESMQTLATLVRKEANEPTH